MQVVGAGALPWEIHSLSLLGLFRNCKVEDKGDRYAHLILGGDGSQINSFGDFLGSWLSRNAIWV